MIRLIALLALIPAAIGGAQWPQPPRSLPKQVPIPGAPTSDCRFQSIDANTPIRITAGAGPIPYHFACGENRPAGICITGTLPPGLVVSLGVEQGGWACITGGDSTTGWIPANRLAEVPATPRVPEADWLGWWHHPEDVKGLEGDRLLITRAEGSDLLRISGRAYWPGKKSNGVVHFGQFQADARPIGIYLHAADICVVDLKFNPASHTLDSYDNSECGGINVHFSGEWIRFTPKKNAVQQGEQ